MADRPPILDALLDSLRGDAPIREVVVGAT